MRGRSYAVFSAVILALSLPGAVWVHLRVVELFPAAWQPWLNAAFLWSLFARADVIVSASGVLQPEGEVRRFYAPVEEGAVATQVDNSMMMERVEVLCANCEAHLGHVFPDGPQPTGLRFCMNSASLKLDESDREGES